MGNVWRRALGETHECEALAILVSSGGPGWEEGEGDQLVWAMSSAIPDCDDPCGEGGIPFREVGSIFPASKEISSPLAIGAFGPMGVGLLGELPVEGCSKLSGIAIDCSSSISIVMLGQETMSLGHSVTKCGDEIGVKDHWQTILGRFTCKCMGSWEGPMWESGSQIGSLGSETCNGSRPLFRPSRYTTSTPHCRSLQTSK